jgi:hypothetical protein
MRQTVAVGVIKSVEKTDKVAGKGKFSIHVHTGPELIPPFLVTKSAEKAAKKK